MRIELMQPSRRLRQAFTGLLLVCLLGLQGIVAYHAVAHAFEGVTAGSGFASAASPAVDDHAPDEPTAAHNLCVLCTLATHLTDVLPGTLPVMVDAGAAAALRACSGFAGADRAALSPLNRGPPRA